jgi:hypothetical protein
MARLKAETHALLELSDDVVVSVTELACRKPGCPDIETIVAVMRTGERPCIARVHKPILQVTAEDFAAEFTRLGWRVPRSG